MSKKRGIWHAISAATITATGNMSAGDYFPEAFNEMEIIVSVTAPDWSAATITFKYQISPDGGTTWADHPDGAFSAISANGAKAIVFAANAGQFGRLAWTVTGTPTITANAWLEGKKHDG